jgi:hypothetical protein
LLVALTLATPLKVAEACGHFPFNRILLESEDAFLSLPYSTFSYEAKRVPAPYPPPFHAVPPERGDVDSPGTAQARQTEKVDLDELSKALETIQPDPAQRQKILADYTAVRQALTTHAQAMATWKEHLWTGYPFDATEPAPAPPLSVPEGLPGEFADYLRGAIAYRRKQMETARQAWLALLERPAEQRQLRSTWAAYMLGRGYADENAAEAIRWYQKTRELAREGFADGLGLASTSLGWEARAELQQGHHAAALELFRVQLDAGDPAAPVSLLLAARHTATEAGPEARAACVRNPTARRLIVGYLLSSSMLGSEVIPPWLESFQAVDTPVEEADRLAWAAYRAGHFDHARAWLEKVPAQAPIAQWLRAKLLLRDGRISDALPLIADVAARFPRDENFQITRDLPLEDDEIFDAWRAHAEIGGLRLARSEYIVALDALVQSIPEDSDRHWIDAAYVAEQVLTLKELREFVDRRWPEADAPAEEGAKTSMNTRLRYLLARRLARQGRLAEAAPYYPAALQEDFRRYAEALRRGTTPRTARVRRADALWTAAQLAREMGMELLGTESDPDWAWVGGGRAFASTATHRPTTGVIRASNNELLRARRHLPQPDQRYHYRFHAADLAWDAAQLMPDQSDQTALVLATAGNWVKNLDPKAADRFYKALVNRCGKTGLGQQASARRWLPEVNPAAR